MGGESVFEDGENWSSHTIGIKEIALEQFRRCMSEGSKTFSLPNQREIYINCVKQLEVILYPKLNDKNFKQHKENIVENEKKLADLKKEYADTLKRLKEKSKDINENLLNQNYETDLIEIYREKLILLSNLLDDVNYFNEISITD